MNNGCAKKMNKNQCTPNNGKSSRGGVQCSAGQQVPAGMLKRLSSAVHTMEKSCLKTLHFTLQFSLQSQYLLMFWETFDRKGVLRGTRSEYQVKVIK